MNRAAAVIALGKVRKLTLDLYRLRFSTQLTGISPSPGDTHHPHGRERAWDSRRELTTRDF